MKVIHGRTVKSSLSSVPLLSYMIAINKEFALCTIKCHLQTGKHQLAAVSHAWFYFVASLVVNT